LKRSIKKRSHKHLAATHKQGILSDNDMYGDDCGRDMRMFTEGMCLYC
jgi:hypothetical protein